MSDAAPNAFATGRDAHHAVVCVTTGLLERFDRSELEGVRRREAIAERDVKREMERVIRKG